MLDSDRFSLFGQQSQKGNGVLTGPQGEVKWEQSAAKLFGHADRQPFVVGNIFVLTEFCAGINAGFRKGFDDI